MMSGAPHRAEKELSSEQHGGSAVLLAQSGTVNHSDLLSLSTT